MCYLWVHLGIQLWYKQDSLNSDLSRKYELGILLRFIQFLSWSDRYTKHTLCVRYCTVSQFGVHLVLVTWFKQTLCVGYFTKIHPCISMIFHENKVETMCKLFYCVEYGYIGAFKLDKRKTHWTVI